MILFWILVVLAIVALVSRVTSKQEVRQTPALDVLKERYAKGEIDRREFEQKKKDII